MNIAADYQSKAGRNSYGNSCSVKGSSKDGLFLFVKNVLTTSQIDDIITASGDNPAVRKQFLWIETKTEMETIMISWSRPQRSLALRRAFLLPKWREAGVKE